MEHFVVINFFNLFKMRRCKLFHCRETWREKLLAVRRIQHRPPALIGPVNCGQTSRSPLNYIHILLHGTSIPPEQVQEEVCPLSFLYILTSFLASRLKPSHTWDGVEERHKETSQPPVNRTSQLQHLSSLLLRSMTCQVSSSVFMTTYISTHESADSRLIRPPRDDHRTTKNPGWWYYWDRCKIGK